MAERAVLRTLSAALATAALMPLNSTMIAVAVPDIAAELREDPALATHAIVTSYLVAAIALQGPGGKLGDRLGQRRVLAMGQVLVAVGALLGWVAGTLALLAASRVLIAAGSALITPATLALIRTELPAERRGRAFGTFGAVMSLAAGVGPILGGELAHLFGWRSLFLANVPVLVVAAAVGAAGRLPGAARRDAVAGSPDAAPTDRAAARSRFDLIGSALLTAALVAAVIGLQGREGVNVVLLAAAGALLAGFVAWERRASDPVVALALFRSRSYTSGTLVIALLNLVMYALLFEVPLLLAAFLALSPQAAGRVLAAMTGSMVVTSLIAGRLTDRFGARPLAVAGVLAAGAALLLLHIRGLTRPTDFVLPLALLGLGIGLANPAAQHASLMEVPAAHSGMAAGLGSTLRYLGGIAGVAILGRLLEVDGTRDQALASHQEVTMIFLAVLVVTLGCAAFGMPGRDSTGAARAAAHPTRWAARRRRRVRAAPAPPGTGRSD